MLKTVVLVLLCCPLLILGSSSAALMEWNTDRPGSDYAHFDLSRPVPQLCQERCQNEPNCKAWTYVRPGITGAKSRCWLKNAIPPLTPNPYCVSGVKVAVTPSGEGGQPPPEQPAE
jgi:hypothetical protein